MWIQALIGGLFGLFISSLGYGFMTFEFYMGIALLIAMQIAAKTS